jgi:IS30 family transposase
MNKTNSNQGKKYSHLSIEEREEIAIALELGMKQCEIATIISRSASTVSRELKRNSSSINIVRYRANRAQLRYEKRKKENSRRKRIPNKKLKRYISKMIKKGYSPEIVAFKASNKNSRWKTNHETIYQWIYAERKDLILFLVKSHRTRYKRSNLNQKRAPKIPNRTMIEQRPECINLRSRIGDWETDTIISRQSKDAVMILANRCTRRIILKKLKNKNAYCMYKAIVKSLKGFPAWQRKSITYDNGTENTLHELTNRKLGTESYFCNPYHSWEKGTVENLIGIIRRFFPKKTDWKKVTQWDLNKVSRFINNRPMKCLGYKTPYQVHVALAD